MSLPKRVKLVEVGPRDGLQNEPDAIPTENKLAFIAKLAASGLEWIEATSFVSPKAIPQLANHHDVLQALDKNQNVHYSVLVPNWQGYERARNAGATAIAVFTAVSETFTQKNINCSIEESFTRFEPVIADAKKNNIFVRGYISCVWGCPYEGDMAPQKTVAIAQRLFDLGCEEISLGDTIGVATPGQVNDVLIALQARFSLTHFAVHFHNTYGQALANIYAALQQGIAIIDSSVAGLGGCPYAKGAAGNVATEDVVYLLQGLGIKTGVDLDKLIAAGEYICHVLKRKTDSRVAQARAATARETMS